MHIFCRGIISGLRLLAGEREEAKKSIASKLVEMMVAMHMTHASNDKKEERKNRRINSMSWLLINIDLHFGVCDDRHHPNRLFANGEK